MSHGASAVRMPPRTELTRKSLHLVTALIPIAWALAWLPQPWITRGVLVLGVIAILAEAARALFTPVRAFIARLVGTLFRAHEWRGILGATWLAVAMALAVLLLPSRAAITALWAAAVGDAAAALVGRALSRSTDRKTLAGSAACAASTALGAAWLAGAPPMTAIAIGLAAALAERPRLPVDDNLRVTAAAGLAAWGVGVA